MVRMSSVDSTAPTFNLHASLLMDLAKRSVQSRVLENQSLQINLEELPQPLVEPRATFVTLHIHNQLRGCIGTLNAHQALAQDVIDNAESAAVRDPRFNPVTPQEIHDLHYHISVLTPPEPMIFKNEADLLDQIVAGIDGLILTEGPYRGTFLPSVWESLPAKNDFLNHLKRKAGLPSTYWSDTLTVSRYRTESIT